ncbi:MAG: hypothetical protein HN341_13740 [Verrucomicrobia bacterium]|nr:hypothetical protein [Verrucomicrobiota bacterium]
MSQQHSAISTMSGLPTVLTCCALVLVVPAFCAATDDSLESIQSRIAALSAKRASSTTGRFSVNGTNRLENASLMGWCEDIADRVESITGVPLPFEKRAVRLVVQAGVTAAPGGVAVRHGLQAGRCLHRVSLRDYDAAYALRGRQALCRVMLSSYVDKSLSAVLALPPWLWKGVEQNLLPSARNENIEHVLSAWRAGELASIWEIVGDGEGEDPRQLAIEGQDRLSAYGVFVRWLSALPGRKKRFQVLFERLVSGVPVTVESLQSLVVPVDAPTRADEAWDLWLLRQRHVVRTLGSVSTRTIDELRSELLIYPGACGIPLDVELPRRAALARLLPFRRSDWVSAFIRSKRRRLDLLAAGRAEAFQSIVAELGEILSALESDASDIVLLQRLDTAEAALDYLAARVRAAGGALVDSDAQETDN